MAWRLARSLEVLRDEVRTLHPGTIVWTIGDEAHQQSWSDHNPNECCDVVCAADILSNAGLDLAWLAATITATDPPALKYVIYRDRIWFPQAGWQPYRGQFHTHVHVSVGWGPDGRSTGPYDDTSPWGLLAEEEDVAVDKEALSTLVWTDGVIPAPLYAANGVKLTTEQYEANTRWAWRYYIQRTLDELRQTRREGAQRAKELATLRGQVAGLTTLVQQLLAAPAVDLTPAQLADLTAAVTAAATEGAEDALARTSLTVAEEPA